MKQTPPPMPPRSKIPLLISLALISLFLILLFGARLILLGSYEDLEEKEAIANVERVSNALNAELESITSLAKDFAGWDDSYRFVQDGNSEFIRKNLDGQNLEQLGMNLVVYLDTRGKWVYTRSYDLLKKQDAPFPKSLYAILTPANPLLKEMTKHSFCEGILSLPEGILLVSAVPILTSEYSGPVAGTLIMGRFLNSASVERFSHIAKLTLRVYAASDRNLPVPLSSFGHQKSLVVRGFGKNSISAFSLLSDVYGKPALVVRVDTPGQPFTRESEP